MNNPLPFPDGWFSPEDRQPAALNLVKGPVLPPCEAEPFSFRLAVLIATLVLAAGAVGARFWILPAFLAEEGETILPVVQLRSAEFLEERKREPVERVARVEPAQPFAPRAVVSVAIPAVQPEELVQAEWERPADAPYDPSDLIEEAELPFPPVQEEPKLAKTTPKKSNPKSTRPRTRLKSTPKPVATRPSRSARVLHRYQPPYPKGARLAGTEGRVVLSVQVRSDGRVGSVRVANSSGSAVLDSAAISAVKRWLFAPEEKDGQPVTTNLNVPFRFALR